MAKTRPVKISEITMALHQVIYIRLCKGKMMKLFILLIHVNIDILISGMLWKGKIIGRNENEVFFLRGIIN